MHVEHFDIEMTEAFTAGVMIFIEQFRARWPWTIGLLESWLSVSSPSEVPASSILRFPSSRCFVPGCGSHPQETSFQFLQASAANTPTATTPEYVSHSWGGNVKGKESWEWKTPGLRKKTTSTGFQHIYRPWSSSPELFNKIKNKRNVKFSGTLCPSSAVEQSKTDRK